MEDVEPYEMSGILFFADPESENMHRMIRIRIIHEVYRLYYCNFTNVLVALECIHTV